MPVWWRYWWTHRSLLNRGSLRVFTGSFRSRFHFKGTTRGMYKFESCFLKKPLANVLEILIIVQLFFWKAFCTLHLTAKLQTMNKLDLTSDKRSQTQTIWISIAGYAHHLQLSINAPREQFFLLLTDIINALSKTDVLWLTYPFSFNSIEWGGSIPLFPASQHNDVLDCVYSW